MSGMILDRNPDMMRFKQILAFMGCLALPLAVGALSGYLTAEDTAGWYQTIRRPAFTPPDEVFGPVWTTLYVLMGISLFIVWNSPPRWARKKALSIFFLQLFFNFSWSIVFFCFHLLFIAVVNILVLWIMIVYMLYSFKQVKPVAAYINIPYLLWVGFATVLTMAIWKLN